MPNFFWGHIMTVIVLELFRLSIKDLLDILCLASEIRIKSRKPQFVTNIGRDKL